MDLIDGRILLFNRFTTQKCMLVVEQPDGKKIRLFLDTELDYVVGATYTECLPEGTITGSYDADSGVQLWTYLTRKELC